MGKLILLILGLSIAGMSLASASRKLEEDVIATRDGDLVITFVGHGSLMFRHKDKIIHIDPVSAETDYERLPKADIILITHEHFDHLDIEALKILKKEGTRIVMSESCSDKCPGGTVMKNGGKIDVLGYAVEAVPAYNIRNKRPDGQPFHPKGRGNGYVLTIGGKKVYVAGDTENTPEMKALRGIDVAFLPMNLPYTMTPEMAADAARAFKPGILYPYHYGETDTAELVNLLKDETSIEVRIRKLK
ncbi:MAG: MBL fold metallo-hydrolase [Acidobacteriota bacterium]|nr:MBL fold metallo-hydrolase [Acidobacteriota bacterium]